MDESAIVEKIMEFGLTRQEAVIYVCLFRSGELTGYEVAKQTGISRSNVYSALAGLVENGAAYVLEGSASKYTPVPIEEFCENKIRSLEEQKKYLAENIPQVTAVQTGYITIEGYRHICDKIYHMLHEAKQRIYWSAPAHFIAKWQEELEALVKNKIKVVLITDEKLAVANSIFYLTEKKEDELRLIIDSEYVLTGEITGKESDTCLYCGQSNFVKVFKEALRNEIRLIELTAENKDKTPGKSGR